MDGQSSPKRARRVYHVNELDRLESVFSSNSYPDRHYRNALAAEMKVSQKHIQIWFQNRRARERTLQRKERGIIENPIERMKLHWQRGVSPVSTQSPNENCFLSSPSSLDCEETARDQSVTTVKHFTQYNQREPLKDRNIDDDHHRYSTTQQPEESACSPGYYGAPLPPAVQQDTSLAATEVFPNKFDDAQCCNSQEHNDENLDDDFFSDVILRRSQLTSVSNISDVSNSSFVEINGTMSSIEERPAQLRGLDSAMQALFSPVFNFIFEFQ